MPAKRFQKKKEDFVCEKCNKEVKGDGYTNHCPYCLWSKHVDVNPGDRAETCQGLMKPAKLESDKKGFMLTNECVICGYSKRNRLSKNDDFDAALEATKIKS